MLIQHGINAKFSFVIVAVVVASGETGVFPLRLLFLLLSFKIVLLLLLLLLLVIVLLLLMLLLLLFGISCYSSCCYCQSVSVTANVVKIVNDAGLLS